MFLGGILGGKATGEPSVLMGVSAMIALRNAINAAKEDQGLPTDFWSFGTIEISVQSANWNNIMIHLILDAPATNENIQNVSGISSDSFYIE